MNYSETIFTIGSYVKIKEKFCHLTWYKPGKFKIIAETENKNFKIKNSEGYHDFFHEDNLDLYPTFEDFYDLNSL